MILYKGKDSFSKLIKIYDYNSFQKMKVRLMQAINKNEFEMGFMKSAISWQKSATHFVQYYAPLAARWC